MHSLINNILFDIELRVQLFKADCSRSSREV